VLVVPGMRMWDKRWLAWGLALAALLYVPLLINEVRTGLGNTRNILAETLGGQGGEKHPGSFLWIPVYALRFLTLDVTYHELTGYWGGPDEVACLKAVILGTPPRPHHPLRVLAFIASLALALTAVVVAGRAAWRARKERAPVFALAFAAALVANMLLLGLAQKQVFGHYVTNLYPFVFVAYASLGAATSSWTKRATAVVAALALAFCLGGVEATLAVSRRVDARIGLEVHRRTLERIRDDAVAEHIEGEPVRLDFGYRSSWYDWSIFADRAMGLSLRFDKRAARRWYRLVEKDKPMSPGGAWGEPVDVGHALLYRHD
jgi:hypothetical protein